MSIAELLYNFKGRVECRRSTGPLGLTLIGRTADPGVTWLAFQGPAPAELPASLEGALVQRSGAGEYRIASGGRSWTIAAGAIHAHRDVGAAFYAAVPPRPVPAAKRLTWRIVLALAGWPLGRRLLTRLRRALQ